MPRSFKKLITLLCLPGIWMSWLTLVLIAAVLVGVVAARFGVPVLLDWGVSVPVLGSALTLNGLTDLQWYIFALLVLFGGVCTFRDDAHVSVDFLSLRMSRRQRLWVRVIGDIVFLLPFCAIIAWYGWGFAETAWRTAEGSTQGGLNSRWLIKAALPLSFTFLGLAGLLRGIGTLMAILSDRDDTARLGD